MNARRPHPSISTHRARTPRLPSISAAVALACSLALSACGGDDAPTSPTTLTGVSVSASSLSLTGVGSTATLTASLQPSGASASISWTSSAPGVASVSGSGSGSQATVTAVGGGSAQITARAGSFSATASVTVVPEVRTLSLPSDTLELRVGDSEAQTATIDGDTGADATLTWSTADPAIATVSAAGVVTGVAAGTTLLTATAAAFPSVSATRVVRVQAISLTLLVTPESAQLATGDTLSLEAAVTADPGVDTSVEWTSSDPAIASVSATGLVTALAPGGPVTITATSTVAPSISASAQITVTAPPPAGVFLTQRIGVGGSAGGYGAQRLHHLGSDDVVAGVGFQGAGGGSFRNGLLRLANGVSSDITADCCDEAGLPTALSGESGSGVLTAFGGDNAFGGGPARVVFRTDAGAATVTSWRPEMVGFSGDRVVQLRANGGGTYLALTSSGRVQSYDQPTDDWATLDRMDLTSGNKVFGGEAVMAGADDIAALSCDSSTPTLLRWTAGVESVLPAPSGACETNFFDTQLRGRSIAGMMATNPAGVHEFDGTTWQTLGPAIVGSDVLKVVVRCGDDRFGAAESGRIYQWSGSQWEAIGEPGVVTAINEFNSRAVIDCAPDGPLRVLSGGARLMRRAGSSWVEENYAPRLAAVHASSSDHAFAVGDGVVYRWNGSSWSRSTIFAEPDLRFRDVITTGSDFALAVGEIRRSAPDITGGVARFDGTGWHTTSFPEFRDMYAVVSLGGEEAMAIAEFSSGSTISQVVRFNGTGWDVQVTGLSRVQHLAASGPDNVMALHPQTGAAARFDGTSWQTIPSVPGSFQAFGGALYTASADFAMAGNCANGVGRLVRWNGSGWANAPLGSMPTPTCVRDLFGTSATDVFAIVDAPDTQLWHWDGSSWEVVAVTDMHDAHTGHAVSGTAMLVGGRALTAVARRPAP